MPTACPAKSWLLQERLDAFEKSFESGALPYNAPHEAIEMMHRATVELRATGLEEVPPLGKPDA